MCAKSDKHCDSDMYNDLHGIKPTVIGLSCHLLVCVFGDTLSL